jgi:hypothetical protein
MKYVSIVSAERSGSTLLDMLLGSVDGFFSGGELRYLWERGLMQQRRCGCGLEVSECVVWSKVLAAPSLADLDPAEVVRWQHNVARIRHTRRLLDARDSRARNPQLSRLIETMSELYARIGSVTGARVIVDSSKRPADAALATLLPGVQPYIVHLVRDPRAVAFSRGRTKQEFDHERRPEMARRRAAPSAANWLWLNVVASRFPRVAPGVPYLRVRYEDLVAEPEAWLSSILNFVDEPNATAPVDSRVANLEPNHTVSGNPGRFATGNVEIRLDEKWRTAMGAPAWCESTAITLPALHKYGYAIRSGAPLARTRTRLFRSTAKRASF